MTRSLNIMNTEKESINTSCNTDKFDLNEIGSQVRLKHNIFVYTNI